MENVHHFKLDIHNDFDRIFQPTGGEYLIKFTCRRDQRGNEPYHVFSTNYIITFEKTGDFSCFVTIKLFFTYGAEALHQKSYIPNDQTEYEVKYYGGQDYDTYICSVKVARFENWQNVPDPAKIKATKGVKDNKSLSIEDVVPLNINQSTSQSSTVSRLNHLSLDMSRLLEQSELSDVILSVDSTDFKAHKLVLSARSSVFAKMFQHPMKENCENRVLIPDISSEVLKELLTFIYTGVVTIKDKKMARNLYVAADKYDVGELCDVCSESLKKVDLNSALDTLALADLYKDKILKQSVLSFIASNYSQIKKHERWDSFMKENQSLTIEILSFSLDKRVLYIEKAKEISFKTFL